MRFVLPEYVYQSALEQSVCHEPGAASVVTYLPLLRERPTVDCEPLCSDYCFKSLPLPLDARTGAPASIGPFTSTIHSANVLQSHHASHTP